jgi:hypothetical protein
MVDQFDFEFTYQEYLNMDIKDREQIFFALYALFNNEALAYDMSQREIYDMLFEQTIEDQHYEFAIVLKDFRNYFEDDF